MRQAVLVAIALFVSAFTQPSHGDRPGTQIPTFRSSVSYVEVDATVTGKDGRSIDDLRKEDFALFEGGTPQEITSFTHVDIPVAAAAASTPPNSHPNEPILADSISNTAVSGRVFALVLDAQQTEFRDSKRVIDAATRFVEEYAGAGDLVAVVGTGGRVAQSFTTQRAFSLRAIDRFRGERARSSVEAAADDVTLNLDLPKSVAVNPNATIGKNDQCMNLLHAMGTVSALSRFMQRIPHRRRAIVLFGSGIKIPGECDDRIMRNTAEEANRASVTVYSVDVRGLPEAGTPLTLQSYGDDPDKPGWASALRDETELEKETLRYLSSATGGFAAVNVNDLAPAFARIMRENSSYYLLGFSPSNERRDGKFHELEVKVSRPGVEVRARTGYVAAKDGGDADRAGSRISAALAQALADPFPVSDIPIRASVAAFRGEKGKAALSLTIEIDASRFAFREANGLHTDGLEVALYSARRGKAVVDAHELLQLSLGGNYAAVRADGLRVGQRIEMPPGHHRLLIGLHETNGGLIGTLPFELDVPDFAKSTPSFGSIVLASAASARVQTTHADL